jgi:hypothetical protein
MCQVHPCKATTNQLNAKYSRLITSERIDESSTPANTHNTGLSQLSPIGADTLSQPRSKDPI